MKKNFLKYSVFLCISVLLYGCTINSYDETDLSDLSVGQEIEEYGKQMGKTLQIIVTQMNKNGDDFSNLTSIKTAIIKYHPQNMFARPISIEEFDESLQRKPLLTPVQLDFLRKIDEIQAKSRSANEFMLHLKGIIKEIQTTVPEIQQKNLLKMTASLYYLIKEMDLLLKEGLMPVDLNQPLFIRLKSDGEVNGFWSSLWAGACVIASNVGSTTLYALEGLAFASGVTLALVGSCLLLSGDTKRMTLQECIDFYADHCVSGPCGDCLHYCRAQGILDGRCKYK